MHWWDRMEVYSVLAFVGSLFLYGILRLIDPVLADRLWHGAGNFILGLIVAVFNIIINILIYFLRELPAAVSLL